MNAAKEMGWVIFANPEGTFELEKINAACVAAKIPEHFVHAIRPRSAFIRSARELVKSGKLKADFRKSIRDDEDALTFAFVVQQEGVTADNADFGVEALVKFHKKEQWVEVLEAPPGVSLEAVTAQARELYKHAGATWTCSDVNYLIRKFVAQKARQIGLKAGVSFLPYQAEESVNSLKTFYSELKVSFFTLPIGHNKENAANIALAVAKDMKAEMDALTLEINGLKAEGKLTERASQTRLEALQKNLQQYQDLAQAVQTDLAQLIKGAGETAQVMAYASHPVDALIALVQGGEHVPEILCHLHQADPRGSELLALVQSQEISLPSIGDVEPLDGYDVPVVGAV